MSSIMRRRRGLISAIERTHTQDTRVADVGCEKYISSRSVDYGRAEHSEIDGDNSGQCSPGPSSKCPGEIKRRDDISLCGSDAQGQSAKCGGKRRARPRFERHAPSPLARYPGG